MWYIWCITTFYVTSPRVLVVYMMYYIVLCYIPQGTVGVYGVLHRSMLHPPGYWRCIWCSTLFYVTSPRVLVMYYIVLCYIPKGTGGIYGVLHRSMLHPSGYWWYICCITTFYVTSPNVLVVYYMYYNILCYIPQGTAGIYGVLHRSILHTSGYWWYMWCITTFFVASPRVLVVYNVYYNILYYISQGTGGIYGVLQRFMLHPPGYWWCIWCTTSFYVTSPRVLLVYMAYYIVPCYIPQGTFYIFKYKTPKV